MITPEDPLHVLVVDDDPIFSSLAQSALKRAGILASVSFDGADALDLLDLRKFDAAIIDLVMPKIDGLRLIAHLRGDQRHLAMPIIVVSSRQDPTLFERALLLGAASTHAKPIKWPAMISEISALTGRDLPPTRTR